MYADDTIYLRRWISDRDPDAFREIVVRYAAMVLATAKRVLRNADDAEDVAQECFQALAETTRVPADYLGPWLHRVTTNIAIEKIRTTSRRVTREETYASAQPVVAEMTWNDIYSYVDEALESLPDKLRVPLVAHYLEGHSQTAIADTLGIPRQTLTNRIHKGVYEIRTRLRRRGIQVGCSALGAMLVSCGADAAPVPASVFAGLGKLALAGVGSGGFISSAIPSMPAVAALSSGVLKSVGAWAAGLLIMAGAAVGAVYELAPRSVLAATDVAAAPAQLTTASEVLDAYRENQKRAQRLTVTYEMTANWNRVMSPDDPYYAKAHGSAVTHQSGEISSDGHRAFTNTATWGTNGMTLEPVPQDKPMVRVCGFDGEQDYQLDVQGRGMPGSGSMGKGAPLDETLDGPPSYGNYYAIWGMVYDAPAWGYINTEGRRIDDILEESGAMTMRVENVRDLMYYVVSAETECGTFTAWFDPYHGYNVAQIHMQQRTGHLSRKGSQHPFKETFVRDIVYTVTNFADVDGVWVPKEYTRKTTETQPSVGTSYNWNSSFKRTSIKVNPDLDGQKTFAFLRGVPEGSQMWYRKTAGEPIEFLSWQGGKLAASPKKTRR
ncbi:MAG: sigma-70 family RNA polymerase sigma factor [Candidatus Hydrogenedentes bacterium]|nr:sigma-70 family RNA polymerase sigma factor [Candidatus Hydrogenedentota bacterium]